APPPAPVRSPEDSAGIAPAAPAVQTDVAPPAATAPAGRRRAARWTRWAAAACVAAAAIVGVGAAVATRDVGAALDPSLYVVLPFEHQRDAAPMLLSGDLCEQLLYETFRRWSDVRLVSDLRVADALARAAVRPSVPEAIELARGLEAGFMVWGRVWQLRDTVHVDATLYDVGARREVRAASVHIPSSLEGVQDRFRELAAMLVLGASGEARDAAAADAAGASRTDALRAYEQAHRLLSAWDLEGARAELRRATALDPEFAQAQLRLAQVVAWMDDEPLPAQREAAARAVALRERLAPHDRLLAGALLALGDERYADACRDFSQIVAADSTDFAAQYGLGECNRKDPVVVRDARSPSGWAFRGSYQRAVAAYTHAFDLVPSVHAAFRRLPPSRLAKLLFTEPNRLRFGTAVEGRDTLELAAHPSLSADTLAFIPYPVAELNRGRPPGGEMSAMVEAVERNRRTLQGILAQWVRAFPRSADAYEVLVRVQEASGQLALAREGYLPALDGARMGRSLSADSLQRLRLGVDELRILLKLARWEEARRLGDSLLRAWPRPAAAEACHELASVAALLGRPTLAAQLLRPTSVGWRFYTLDGRLVSPPPTLVTPAVDLLVYASVGAPADSIRALERRVWGLIPSYFATPEGQARARDALLGRPAVLAFPSVGPSAVYRAASSGSWYVARMQDAWAKRDAGRVRAILAEVDSARGVMLPGSMSVDATYQEAWLLAQAGDTAAAIRRLDATLEALPTVGSQLLDFIHQAAALPRAMALRAELAGRTGDPATARRWSSAVAALWSGAEPTLRGDLERATRIKID
ncbi:MAG TPA: hypothetical protein VKA84_26270, partial [Gemmatimonadaceae bacterium]|nr:hypothetical protein [Gemmatimonadaceae bacterium]